MDNNNNHNHNHDHNNQNINIRVPANLRNIEDTHISDISSALHVMAQNVVNDQVVFGILMCLGNIIRFTVTVLIDQLGNLDPVQKTGITVLLWLYIMQVNLYTIGRHIIFINFNWYGKILHITLNLPIYIYTLYRIDMSWNMVLWLVIYIEPILQDYNFVMDHVREVKLIWLKKSIINNITPATESEPDCPICKETLTEAYKINCNHAFHRHCLIEHINQGNLICPMCRQPY